MNCKQEQEVLTMCGGGGIRGGGGGGRISLRLLLLERVGDGHGGLRHAADGEGEASAAAVLHRSRRRQDRAVD